MLKAYIDDSGWGGPSPIFVLAGYISTIEKWEIFSQEWQAVLDLEQPKKLPYLKMNESVQLKKKNSSFYGWSEEERDERLKKFVPVINRNVEHGVATVIPIAKHQELFKGTFKLSLLDRPYFLAFFSIARLISRIAYWMKPGAKVDIIFDTQDNEKKSEFLNEFKSFLDVAPLKEKEILNYPSWESDTNALPLQAADMLAWHFRRQYYIQFQDKDPIQDRTNVYLANIFDYKHDVLDLWSEERLKEAAASLFKK